MYQFFVDPDQIHIAEKKAYITGQDVRHIKNVLRMHEKEELYVCTGDSGEVYHCSIEALGEESVTCKILSIREQVTELNAEIVLYQGLPKADKMEWIIQKAVELGVSRIVPVMTRRCVVKLDEKKAKSKQVRWQGIAEAAAKQSKRGVIPKVEEPVSFKEALESAAGMDVKVIPYELAENMEKTRTIFETVKRGQKIAVFIGPEGGFEVSEVEEAAKKGVEAITLGKRILRTETAGLLVLSWLVYLLEE